MASKNDEQEDEVVAVVDDDSDALQPDEIIGKEPADKKDVAAGQPEADDASDDSEDGEEEGEPEAKAEGDARVATDEAADNAQNRDRKRETSKERRQRQKAHAQRREAELNLYKARNETLERRFSQLEARQARGEQITIGQAITTVEAQIAEAKRLEADAIKNQDGESAVEARDIREALENKHTRLVSARERAARPVAKADKEPPPEMRQALSWIERNKDWYDPKGGNEESAIASAIEDRLTREGRHSPSTPEFWKELDKRLIARGIKKTGAAPDDDLDYDDSDDGEDEPKPKALNGAAKKNGNGNGHAPSGGPKVSVGGEKRTLKANEVYIDPERKKAMQEAGVWDDPKLRQQMLKRYHQFDRDARSSRSH